MVEAIAVSNILIRTSVEPFDKIVTMAFVITNDMHALHFPYFEK